MGDKSTSEDQKQVCRENTYKETYKDTYQDTYKDTYTYIHESTSEDQTQVCRENTYKDTLFCECTYECGGY